jgi:hypothetical protein
MACTDVNATTGTLVVAIEGLPPGAAAAVSVAGPNGFSELLDATATLADLAPGEYTVSASPVSHSDALFACGTVSTVVVSAGHTAAAQVSYEVASGAIDLTVTGVPAGLTASILIAGGGDQRTVHASGIVANLAPGPYTITAESVINGDGDRFGAGNPQNVLVPASLTPIVVSVSYSLASGALTVVVSGLPPNIGSALPVTITGSGAFSREIAATTTLRGLTPGEYTVTASDVSGRADTTTSIDPDHFSATTKVQSLNVAASPTPAEANVTYSMVSGILTVNVGALPPVTSPDNPVTITGPNGFSRSIRATTTFHGITPGLYTVRAVNPLGPCPYFYEASPTEQQVQVNAGSESIANVAYEQKIYPPIPGTADQRTRTVPRILLAVRLPALGRRTASRYAMFASGEILARSPVGREIRRCCGGGSTIECTPFSGVTFPLT